MILLAPIALVLAPALIAALLARFGSTERFYDRWSHLSVLVSVVTLGGVVAVLINAEDVVHGSPPGIEREFLLKPGTVVQLPFTLAQSNNYGYVLSLHLSRPHASLFSLALTAPEPGSFDKDEIAITWALYREAERLAEGADGDGAGCEVDERGDVHRYLIGRFRCPRPGDHQLHLHINQVPVALSRERVTLVMAQDDRRAKQMGYRTALRGGVCLCLIFGAIITLLLGLLASYLRRP